VSSAEARLPPRRSADIPARSNVRLRRVPGEIDPFAYSGVAADRNVRAPAWAYCPDAPDIVYSTSDFQYAMMLM